MHLPVTPAHPMRPGIGQNMFCAVGHKFTREIWFVGCLCLEQFLCLRPDHTSTCRSIIITRYFKSKITTGFLADVHQYSWQLFKSNTKFLTGNYQDRILLYCVDSLLWLLPDNTTSTQSNECRNTLVAQTELTEALFTGWKLTRAAWVHWYRPTRQKANTG